MYAKKLKKLGKIRIDIIVKESFEELRLELAKANTERLYDKGTGADGQKLTPPYAASTKKKKQKDGLPADRVTLFQTGDFHETFDVEFDKDAMEFFANYYTNGAFVSDILESRYSEKIYGINKEDFEKLKPRYFEIFKTKFLEAMKK